MQLSPWDNKVVGINTHSIPRNKIEETKEQAKRDAEASKREWLLIYKKDRQKEIVITGKNHPAKEQLRIHETYYVYLLEDFLSLPNEHFFENFNDSFTY